MSEFLKSAITESRKRVGCYYKISEICNGKAETVTVTQANACQNSYSVAKAFVVTAIGMLYDDGLLDVNERIVDIFVDEMPKNDDVRWQDMTVHHVLKHSCGFPVGYLDIDSHAGEFREVEDYLGYVLSTRLMYKPGEQKTYSDAAYYLLSRIVSKKTGKRLDTFLWERLFYPLGFAEVSWSTCPKGYPMGATGLYAYTEDVVKLGEVYLRGGEYKGKRIISEEWVDTVMEREYEFHKVCGGKGYAKGGMLGQMLVFFPDSKRAVAWHSYKGESLLDWIETYSDN